MTSRPRIVLLLTALLLLASLALASGAPSTPLAATGSAPPFLALSNAPLCSRAELRSLLPALQPLASDICNACSDTACLGKEEHSECAPGFRCISGPACTNTGPSCQCKIIG
jgi:hypothetical protein